GTVRLPLSPRRGPRQQRDGSADRQAAPQARSRRLAGSDRDGARTRLPFHARMTRGYSLRARLLLGAALVLLAFIAGAGLAVQRAHADSVRTQHFSRLQSAVYLLLAYAELDDSGALVMPPAVAEPRLSVAQSGLYAGVYNVNRKEGWRSPSSVG